MRRLALPTLLVLADCGWSEPPPPPPPAEAVIETPQQRFQGTWRLDASPEEDLRLDALDQVLGGGPAPTDAQWSDADRAWLAWAAEVHTRPETDLDRVALERFSKERAERRLVVDEGSLTVQAPDGAWRRTWKSLSTVVDPQGRDILVMQTRDERTDEQVMVRFTDADHIEVGPYGKTDQLVRWTRVADAP